MNRDSLMEAAFEESKSEMKSDIIFEGDEDLYNNFQRLYYKIGEVPTGSVVLDDGKIEDYSFQSLRDSNTQMKSELEKINLFWTEVNNGSPGNRKDQFLRYFDHFFRKIDSNTCKDRR